MLGKHHMPLGAASGTLAALATTPLYSSVAPPVSNTAVWLAQGALHYGLPSLIGLLIGAVYGLLPDIDQVGSDIHDIGDETADIFREPLERLRRYEFTEKRKRGFRHRKRNALGEIIFDALLWLLIHLLWLIGRIITLLTHFIGQTIRPLFGGHRKLSHTVWLTALFSLPLYFVGGWLLVGAGAAGYFSHLVADATTHAGIAFFRPLSRRRMWVIPRPLTYHTGTPRETVWFWLFLVALALGWVALLGFRITTDSALFNR